MIIIMLGAPGTGKGTLASILAEKINITQVSTGDIFRKHINEQTELGKLANEYISKGQLVPDEVTVNIVKERLEENDAKQGVILDGFPRTVKQAEDLEKILNEKNKKVDLVINLITPEEEIVERIVNRRVCPQCKAVYNLKLKPAKQEGICDICGHELIQREDDNVETIKLRLKTYFDQTSSLINYYEQKGILNTEEVSEKVNRLGKDVAIELVEKLSK